ncbi:23S rRNA (pseudouridine(1915)-N(3))-methyltransferase RlmH [Deltaproteobacteria bacterium TL4]
MYRIRIIWVGKTQEAYLQTGIGLYLKKLSPYVPVETLEIKPVKYRSQRLEQCRNQETEQILKKLSKDETHVFLDETGQQKSSVGLAHWLEQQKRHQNSRINFLIGGAFGWDHSQFSKQSEMLSLSPMTFNHQMVRIILIEQLYRAFTIMNGEPYHH